MEPDWNDIKVLIALSEAGSVAGAARRLDVDGSTVSRRLAALEEALGVMLIIRGGRDFVITPDGRSALARRVSQSRAGDRSCVREACASTLRAVVRAHEGDLSTVRTQ